MKIVNREANLNAAIAARGNRHNNILFVRETNDGRFFYDLGIWRGPGMPGAEGR
jgi:hypothetical protein